MFDKLIRDITYFDMEAYSRSPAVGGSVVAATVGLTPVKQTFKLKDCPKKTKQLSRLLNRFCLL